MPIKQTVMLFFGLILSVSFSFSQKVSCKAATYVVKNIIKDFGAKGNGIADDHAAFEAAANFFNKRGGCGKLIIPYGLYKVGKQVVDTPKRFINGANVIYLDNVSNVSIEGVVNKQGQYPLIKYDNGLYYGAFYNDKEKFALPKCTPTTRNFDIKFAAQVGGAVYINNSTDVSIKNIELDGNLDNMILGGNWGDVGRQLFHVGIFMNEGRNIRLQNIHVHHFALDGLENIGANNLFFENVVTEYNGRQGFSWVDGDSLIAKNCKFNHTGRMSIHSSPAAGIDIEPERKHDISFARFTDCEIAYNYGCGLLMAVAANTVRDMQFNNCTFIGMYNWAAWVPGVDIHFTDCKFYGNVVHTVPNNMVKKVKDITSFKRCYFSDIYNGIVTKKPGGYFFPLNGEKIILDSCTMKIFNRGFFWHSSGCGPTDTLTSEIKNCNIYAANAGEWQASVTGLKITDTKLYSVPGKLNLACPTNFTNLEKISCTPKKMLSLFPESNSVVPFIDSISYFVCKEEKVLSKRKSVLKQRPVPAKCLIFFKDRNCILSNKTKTSMSGTLYFYNSQQKLVSTKSGIVIKGNYTKAFTMQLPSGKYAVQFIQKKMLLGASDIIVP